MDLQTREKLSFAIKNIILYKQNMLLNYCNLSYKALIKDDKFLR